MIDKIQRLFNQMIAPLKRKVLLMIGRGIMLAVDSSKDIQLSSVNLLADETKDKTEVFQHFGFTSNIPQDSELIFLSVGGNREHGIIIGSENRTLRLKNLNVGDTAIYNKNGKYVWIEGDNIKMLVDKIQVNNATNELIAVIHEYFEAVRDGQTITGIGPQPWETATITALQAVIDKLETFKV